MEGEGWHSKEVENVFDIAQCNGFGFQVSRSSETQKLHLHIAKPFHGVPKPSIHGDPRGREDLNDEEQVAFLDALRTALSAASNSERPWTEADIWLTDFLGYLWVTINVERYHDIPLVFDTATNMGYTMTTHTKRPVAFRPREGLSFTMHNLETLMVTQMRKEYDMIAEYQQEKTPAELWRLVLRLSGGGRNILKPYNWSTPHGRAFCAELRATLGKAPTSKSASKCRFHWERYAPVVRRLGILEAGSWSASDAFPGAQAQEPSPKKAKVSEEEEEQAEPCMICLEAPPTTLVLPCSHNVVCDSCSHQLPATSDKAICCQCRRKITHVLYADGTQISVE